MTRGHRNPLRMAGRARPVCDPIARWRVIVTATAGLWIAAPSVAPAAGASERLLRVAPVEVGAMLVVERPARALPARLARSVLSLAMPEAAVDEVLSCLRQAPGGLLVGIIPARDPRRPFETFVAVDLDLPDGEAALNNWLSKHLLPAVRAAFPAAAHDNLRLETAEGGGRIVTGVDDTLVTFAVRERLAFASTDARAVLRWRRGEWPEKPWTGTAGARRLRGRLDDGADLRLLVQPAAWAALWPRARRNSPEELAQTLLALDEFQAASLELRFEPKAIDVRLCVALAESCKGVARVLARPATASSMLGVFPADYGVLARFAWPSAAAVTDGAFALTDAFDASISEEYREDLAAFEKKAGLSWEQGILRNLVHEVVVGVRIDLTKSPPVAWAAIAPLADAAAFSSQLDRLIAHFELPLVESVHGGLRMRASTGGPAFVLAVTQQALIVADGPGTAVDISRGLGEPKAAPADRALAEFYAGLGGENNVAVLVNVARIAKGAPMLPALAGPAFGPLLTGGAAGLTLCTRDRVATLRARWEAPAVKTAPATGDDAEVAAGGAAAAEETGPASVLAEALASGLSRARRQAQRTVAMSRMRGIAQALHIYAQRHEGRLPDSLEGLLREMPDVLTFDMLSSPYDDHGPDSVENVEKNAFVVYRGGLTTRSDPREIILAERCPRDDGASFAFLDGHVEFIPNPRAAELIELIESGAEEVRP